MLGLGLAAKMEEPRVPAVEGKGWHLLTAQVGSSREIAGGPSAHQGMLELQVRRFRMRRVIRIFEGISFLRGRGRKRFTLDQRALASGCKHSLFRMGGTNRSRSNTMP